MSNDLLMLRGEVSGVFNLAVGEPIFLQEEGFGDQRIGIGIGDPKYPAYGGDPDLIAAIDGYMDIGGGRQIVIANGAKQALMAAMYALEQVEGRNTVVMKGPYWPSYPTLARLSGMSMVDLANTSPRTRDREIWTVAAPNNPDGAHAHMVGKLDIWDAAYAHWVYGWNAIPPYARISVWSAAKLFGLSGLRVGWLVTEDIALAEKAREYVEKTTSGVSNESQRRLFHVLEDGFKQKPPEPRFGRARERLLENGRIFNNYLSHYVVESMGLPVTGQGMFAWFRVADPDRFDKALTQAHVKVIPGQACGANRGWYRMSMGHRNNYTESALSALEQALK
jgi:aspartate/methionine/tyrosine aminotransferase